MIQNIIKDDVSKTFSYFQKNVVIKLYDDVPESHINNEKKTL